MKQHRENVLRRAQIDDDRDRRAGGAAHGSRLGKRGVRGKFVFSREHDARCDQLAARAEAHEKGEHANHEPPAERVAHRRGCQEPLRELKHPGGETRRRQNRAEHARRKQPF